MKLIWCDKCYDIFALRTEVWRKCACGKVGGQYNYDGVTATLGGKGRVFGVANPFLSLDWIFKTDEDKKEQRDKHWPEGKGSDCWWGDYEGDVQLFWILSPDGPRLHTKAERVIHGESGQIVKITIKDRRTWCIGDRVRRKEVELPNYENIRLGWEPK